MEAVFLLSDVPLSPASSILYLSCRFIRRGLFIKRLKRLISLGGQLLFILALWFGVSLWQQKDLLQHRAPAPEFTLYSINGDRVALGDIKSERTLLYFFAPWCSICKLSIGNLNGLNGDDSLAVIAVALSYNSSAAVKAFVDDQELEVPVLLGTHQTLSDYKIEMFPTYYVLDDQKKVISKSVGYSTELGMKAQSSW